MVEYLEQTFETAVKYISMKIEENLEELKNTFPFVRVNWKWELCNEADWDSDIVSNGC